MKRLLLSIFFLFALSGAGFAQVPDNVVRWKVAVGDDGALVFTGTIMPGWHIYGLDSAENATTLSLSEDFVALADGAPYEISKASDFKGEKVFFGKMVFGLRLKAGAVDGGSGAGSPGAGASVAGVVTYHACDDAMCSQPIDWEFEVHLQKGPETCVAPGENGGLLTKTAQTVSEPPASEAPETASGLWALILEAILWGLAMLLTPCVFPMVPMTVSFFIKGEDNPAAGRVKALLYGLFIVLLYTVPISIIIILTRAIGGDAVTADIFNWLSTHWLPNLVFFAVFMVFAASFFGLFEITLPSRWVNGSDSKAGKGSLGGIFFLALTLVLVSFSCTGPIVGTVLIKSTAGEFWAPMITMLAFSLAFALPFTLLAMFPGLLKKLPRSGGWLNSVKVCLGFIELALGLKFLSVADQTYHWGILPRGLYLGIWIVLFTLMGLYLLGIIRFRYDEKQKKLSPARLVLSLLTFAFVAWLVSGLFGAPLKAISGYLPPAEVKEAPVKETEAGQPYTVDRHGIKLPLGLAGYTSLEEGLAVAKREGKPVFVDITGHGCVNCREMESRVWSDPRVLGTIKERYILVALYTDDKSLLPESEWVRTESGRMLKDIGRVNSYIVRSRFGVNAQPNYALLSPDGELLAPVRGYNLDVEGFLEFLQKGLE
ncbi:MAG: thioredoxin family protein [Bacteroidales bacterium]|nr:thioredoxin family protein [Bacteroidales bacterium]